MYDSVPEVLQLITDNANRVSKLLAATAAIPAAQDLSKVFVVHGHDGTPKAEVALFIERLGLEAIILHERPNRGRALIAKFREEAAGVGFAVVLMTPDDLGKAKDADTADSNPRARQNVVFELGFFIGKLGPERVAALVKGDVELPSDFEGVVYISLDKEDWQAKLGSELQEAGYEIDWNKVMRRR
jgi:predicted nucleotide-binding protein